MDDRPNGGVVSLPTPRPRFDEVMPLLRAASRPRGSRAAEQRDELAPSYVEHGASPPLRALGASNDHQPADGPCSRLLQAQPYHGGWDRILGTDLNCSESR
jgi:hypothetical protein